MAGYVFVYNRITNGAVVERRGNTGNRAIQGRRGNAGNSGNSTWQYTLDTTSLRNGKHTLQARAYAGMDYSEIVNRTVSVDNAKSEGKGFIPGFGPAVIAALAGSLAMSWYRQRRGR